MTTCSRTRFFFIVMDKVEITKYNPPNPSKRKRIVTDSNEPSSASKNVLPAAAPKTACVQK